MKALVLLFENVKRNKMRMKLYWKIELLFIFILIFFSCNASDSPSVSYTNASLSPKTSSLEQDLPNIIIIMTDDDDYAGIGPYGSEVSTPNLNALADDGVKFANFYNNSRCSPTRASLLTGMYPQKVGVGDLCRPNNETKLSSYLGYLNESFNILPAYLKELGYTTYMSGKWHLGGRYDGPRSKKKPLNKGFDKFFGILGGSSDYFGRKDKEYLLQDENFDSQNASDFYSTDAFTSHAIQFIEEDRKNKQPFFLYLPYTAAHEPIAAPEELVEKYKKIYSETPIEEIVRNRIKGLKRAGLLKDNWNYRLEKQSDKREINEEFITDLATHSAMIEKVDENVGKLTAYLESIDELENTIIIYLSDNGGEKSSLSYVYKSPYRGVKTGLWEGGIKTHCLLHWPEKIKNAKTLYSPVHIMDILPTTLNLINAEVEMSQFDGIDFSGILLNNVDTLNRDYLFWDLYGQQAGIYKNWKWVNTKGDRDFLFNIIRDPLEKENLAKKEKEILNTIKKAFANHVIDNNIQDYATYREILSQKPRNKN